MSHEEEADESNKHIKARDRRYLCLKRNLKLNKYYIFSYTMKTTD